MGCRGVVVEVALLFQTSATSSGWTLALVLTACPTLTYGSKKLLVHGNGHTPVNCVGSQAKLDEGNMWSASASEGVCLTPTFLCMKLTDEDT